MRSTRWPPGPVAPAGPVAARLQGLASTALPTAREPAGLPSKCWSSTAMAAS